MNNSERPEFKVVSLQPEIVVINKRTDSEEIEISPILPSPVKKIIDKIDLQKLLDGFYQEVSEALEDKNLTWEAELEVGIEYFGTGLKAKIKISPKE